LATIAPLTFYQEGGTRHRFASRPPAPVPFMITTSGAWFARRQQHGHYLRRERQAAWDTGTRCHPYQ